MSAGSIVTSIGNFFKSAERLEMERRQRKRRLERGIEKSIDALKEGQREAEREKERFYQRAKEALAVGHRDEAREYMQFSRIQARNASHYTKQQLVWSNALTQVRVASSMQDAARQFSSLAVECGLNPDVFDAGLETMADVESAIGEMNKAVSRKWEGDSRKAGETVDAEGDATIDEMLSQAEREVAAETGVVAPSGEAEKPGRG